MDNHKRCVDCGEPVKTAGRERCVTCARRHRAAAERAAWPLCTNCLVNRVPAKRAVWCTECAPSLRGRCATPEAEAGRAQKIRESGAGKYIRTAETREKIAAGKRGKKILTTQREQHWNWKGGRKNDGNGYIAILVDGEYKKEHRVLMETHLGRFLKSDEEVHHINGRRDDNRMENLLLVTREEHRVLEGRLMRAAYDAMTAGVIRFEGDDYRFAGVPHCPTCTCGV